MKKYRVYAIYTASKPIGEVEAGDEDEAIDKGWELAGRVSLCHQCARSIDIADAHEIEVEEA